MDGKSLNLSTDRLEQLKTIFPEVFTEGQIDFAKLRTVLGDTIAKNEEFYGLSWAGKYDAFKEIQKQTTATLTPDRENSINFDHAQNIFIEGENLEVLRVLQKSYYGKVKMIYIDPPYNTGNDSFVYPDDYSERLDEFKKRTGIINGKGLLNKQYLWKRNTKENGQFHSAWLSMMYPRLYVSRNLLKEDGVIFVSIDESEVYNLRLLLNEIFGEENFRNVFIVRRYDKNLNRQFIEQGLNTFNVGFEYILCYSKSGKFNFNPIYKESSEERQNYGYWKGFWNDADRPTMRYDILGYTPESGQWKWSKDKALKAVENYKTYTSKFSHKMSIEEYWHKNSRKLDFIRRNPNGSGKNKGVENWIPPTDGILRNTNWSDLFASKIENDVKDLFDYPKNIDVISNLITISDDNIDDIILDFFAGSGSTAHAVIEYNSKHNTKKRFICIQYQEPVVDIPKAKELKLNTIADICKYRIKHVLKNASSKVKGQSSHHNLSQFGLKAFKLSVSNFKIWQSDLSNSQDIINQLDFFKDPVINNTEENLVFELLIKSGLLLTSSIIHKDLSDNCLYIINDGKLILSLRPLTPGSIDFIVSQKPDIFICLDSIFNNDDQLKTNIKLQLKEEKIEFKSI
jgi:adenine-specific DNA-methyltransferase